MNALMIIGFIIAILSIVGLSFGIIITQFIVKRNLEKRGMYYSGTSLIAFLRSIKDYRELAQKRGNENLLKPLNRFNNLLIVIPFTFILGLLVMVIGKSMQ